MISEIHPQKARVSYVTLPSFPVCLRRHSHRLLLGNHLLLQFVINATLFLCLLLIIFPVVVPKKITEFHLLFFISLFLAIDPSHSYSFTPLCKKLYYKKIERFKFKFEPSSKQQAVPYTHASSKFAPHVMKMVLLKLSNVVKIKGCNTWL